jgi:hypothetical protein
MNLKQYLAHLLDWLRTFPQWNKSEHITTGIAGSGEYRCLICDYIEREE